MLFKTLLFVCFCHETIISTVLMDGSCEPFVEVIQEQSKSIRELKTAVEEIKNELHTKDKQLEDLRGEINDMRVYSAQMTVSKEERNKRMLMNYRSTAYQSIAFTARLSNHMTNIGAQQTIIFDDAITNVGNAYSPVVGVFTAPNNGTYFFYTSILGHLNQYIETEIVKNGNALVLTYSYGSNRYDQGSNGVVVNLKNGDKVWVRHHGTEGNAVYGYTWSTFSGFQIGFDQPIEL